MKKRGSFIPWVFILIFGLGLGYFYPVFMAYNKIDPIENSYDSNGWNLLNNERNYDAAIKEFKKYLKRDKSNFYAHSGLGWSYFYNLDFEKAMKEFEKVISLNPNQYDSKHSLGWTYLRMKNYKEENGDFSEATNLELEDSIMVRFSQDYLKFIECMDNKNYSVESSQECEQIVLDKLIIIK